MSWAPLDGQPLGNMPVAHGTMCAYDVCIAAPHCTLLDLAVLTSTTMGGSQMDGLLSDAVRAYGNLLAYMSRAAEPFMGDDTPRTLVVNNSWGMFHPSWDFPVGDPQNYSDNHDHPFNIIVASLETAGADILFAAGNCGTECPDTRCQGVTDGGIYGASSSPAVTCVAGVVRSKERIGYSTKGPGRLDNRSRTSPAIPTSRDPACSRPTEDVRRDTGGSRCRGRDPPTLPGQRPLAGRPPPDAAGHRRTERQRRGIQRRVRLWNRQRQGVAGRARQLEREQRQWVRHHSASRGGRSGLHREGGLHVDFHRYSVV